MRRAFLITALMASSPAPVLGCDLTPLAINHSVSTHDGVTVSFGDADSAEHPAAWQGPIRISTNAVAACSVNEDVAIVEKPVLLGSGILFVPTYSGSNNRLYAVDTKTCRVIWQSPVYAGAVTYEHGVLKVGKQRVELDSACSPLDLKK